MLRTCVDLLDARFIGRLRLDDVLDVPPCSTASRARLRSRRVLVHDRHSLPRSMGRAAPRRPGIGHARPHGRRARRDCRSRARRSISTRTCRPDLIAQIRVRPWPSTLQADVRAIEEIRRGWKPPRTPATSGTSRIFSPTMRSSWCRIFPVQNGRDACVGFLGELLPGLLEVFDRRIVYTRFRDPSARRRRVRSRRVCLHDSSAIGRRRVARDRKVLLALLRGRPTEAGNSRAPSSAETIRTSRSPVELRASRRPRSRSTSRCRSPSFWGSPRWSETGATGASGRSGSWIIVAVGLLLVAWRAIGCRTRRRVSVACGSLGLHVRDVLHVVLLTHRLASTAPTTGRSSTRR